MGTFHIKYSSQVVCNRTLWKLKGQQIQLSVSQNIKQTQISVQEFAFRI